jgi:hypothetical protein
MKYLSKFPRLTGVVALLAVIGLTPDFLNAEDAGPAVSHPSFTDDQVAFFSSKVRPLLEANCFKCHGGIGSNGKPKVRSGLQLISRKGVVLGGEHGPAFNTEKPAESLLLEMISYKDEHHEMPPSGKLEPDQAKILNEWVNMGLPWTAEDIDVLVKIEDHTHAANEINETTRNFWSHTKVTRPDVPKVSDSSWQKHPIDAFIYAKLAEQGLVPNGPASKEALARRAYFNLTGLPPTPEQVAAFVNDTSADAWPNLVESLLDSPHYGEQWARHWLDLLRYAESNGFERDSTKNHIWRFRDYVIQAFNEDKPYNQFVREQLAGDELDKVTAQSMIATGYHRLMQWDDEPADRPQHVYDVLDDNVRVTSEAFLAMTVGCARCHDHKIDPIPQKDYYSFVAFFNNITQMDKGRVIQPIPMRVDEKELEERKRKRDEEIRRTEEQWTNSLNAARKHFITTDPELAKSLEINTSGSRKAFITDAREKPHKWRYTTTKPADDWFAVGFRPPSDWKEGEAGFGTNVPNAKPRTGWEGGDIWLQTSFLLEEIPKSLQLQIYHDENAEIYLNGQLVKTFENFITNYRAVDLGSEVLAALQIGRNVVSVHCNSKAGGAFIDLSLHEVSGRALLASLIESRKDKLPDRLRRRLEQLPKRLEELRKTPLQEEVLAMTVQERGLEPPEMFVHIRGSVHAPGDKVQPAFPAILGGGTDVAIPKPKDGAKTAGRRRGLAEWIASPENPRTARVMVNRLWQHQFGRGIVKSSSDFGDLGERPTHPQLLDWLAAEFVKRDWKMKDMHRLIMSSMTYQMASTGSETALSKDPDNNLFWRFPMRRLTAEEIRDSLIAVTGNLNPTLGGKSFYPVLDEAVLATSSTKAGKWGNSSDDERNRRSIYIHIKRSLKPPELEGFDFADTDAPCAMRFVTTVPTQSLAMLNGRFVNEQAEKLGDRLREEVSGPTRAKVKRALELALSRSIREDEIARGVKLIHNLRTEHSLSEAAALNRFCLVALNLNEFVYLD